MFVNLILVFVHFLPSEDDTFVAVDGHQCHASKTFVVGRTLTINGKVLAIRFGYAIEDLIDRYAVPDYVAVTLKEFGLVTHVYPIGLHGVEDMLGAYAHLLVYLVLILILK